MVIEIIIGTIVILFALILIQKIIKWDKEHTTPTGVWRVTSDIDEGLKDAREGKVFTHEQVFGGD